MTKANREKQLVKNTAIVAIGKICTQFISFFLLPLYTAMLSSEEYGTVDLLNTYISLLLPLVFLQIDQAAFRFLIDAREDEQETNKLISTILSTIVIQSILYLILYSFIGIFINNKYKYFLATNVIASMLANILLQVSRGMGDNTTYSIGSLVSGAGTVILNVLFIAAFGWGAYGMLTATLIANIMCFIFIFFKKKIYKRIKINYYSKKNIKELWKYSIPLVPNQLSWWIINASDRTIVTHFINIGANGIYSAANKFSSICITLFNIFNMTWAESASLTIKDKDSSMYFSKILNTSIRIFSSLCIGIIAVMPFVFKFLIVGDEFSTAYYQIPFLMIATIFSIVVSMIGSIYVALKKSSEIAKTSIYSAIINISVDLILIKHIGLYAASISTLTAYFAMAIYRYFDVQKYVKIKINKSIIVLVLLGVIVVSSYYIRNIILSSISLIITFIFSLFYNKSIIFETINILKKRLIKK